VTSGATGGTAGGTTGGATGGAILHGTAVTCVMRADFGGQQGAGRVQRCATHTRDVVCWEAMRRSRALQCGSERRVPREHISCCESFKNVLILYVHELIHELILTFVLY
jgi:hypothetical protein